MISTKKITVSLYRQVDKTKSFFFVKNVSKMEDHKKLLRHSQLILIYLIKDDLTNSSLEL